MAEEIKPEATIRQESFSRLSAESIEMIKSNCKDAVALADMLLAIAHNLYKADGPVNNSIITAVMAKSGAINYDNEGFRVLKVKFSYELERVKLEE